MTVHLKGCRGLLLLLNLTVKVSRLITLPAKGMGVIILDF